MFCSCDGWLFSSETDTAPPSPDDKQAEQKQYYSPEACADHCT